MARLLAIVSVDKARRVRCRAPGCTRTVYARIHVVETDEGAIQVLGSACYKSLYEKDDSLSQKPFYTGAISRQLTEEERKLLDQNTEALIRQFEMEVKQQETFKRAGTEVPSSHTHSNIRQFEMEVKQQETFKRAGTEAPSSRTHSNIPKNRTSRTVKCHFCGEFMETFLSRAPAIGYKCQTCKDKGVVTSLAAKKRFRRN